MIVWSLGGAEEVVCQNTAMTSVRNWAAQLDDPFPVFFAVSPWDDVVGAEDVDDFVAELEVMDAKSGNAPAGVAQIVSLMLSLARRAERAGVPIVVQ